MSGKFLARASALSLALILAACGGDDDSSPIVNVSSDGSEGSSNNEPQEGNDSETGSSSAAIALGTYDGQSFSESSIRRLDGNDTPIAASGSATFRVHIFDTENNELATGDEFDVSFSSGCATSGTATLSRTTVLTSNGIAETTFKANGCSGQDQIKASISDVSGAEAFTTIQITEAEIVDIISDAPTQTSIAPTNGSPDDRSSTSTIKFTVLGEGGGAVGQEKTVKLEVIPAGSDAYLINDEVKTDEIGQVTAEIQAGEANEIIRVVATVMDNGSPIVSTTSAPIAINSKLAVQSRFSLSLDNFSINARNIDGVEINATIMAADQYGNAIRGNTIVNFTTSEGSITPDCELNNEGTCSVVWRSLNATELRPSIYAYTQGEIVSGEGCHIPGNDCTLTPSRIEDTERFVQSSSRGVKAEIRDEGDGSYCAVVFTELLNNEGSLENVIPPSGTEIEFTPTAAAFINPDAANGSVPSDPNIVGASFYDEVCVEPEIDADSEETPRLKLTVTPPEGTAAVDSIDL
ncbi:MAG: hypothetical protein ACQEV6_15415 [Pseudomonadota bacterium]